MPINTQIKKMKLIFIDNESSWDKIITDLDGNIIYEERGNLFTDGIDKEEEFYNWEMQTKNIPNFNIVEVNSVKV